MHLLEAVSSQNGEEALQWVTMETADEYERLRLLALTAERGELEVLPVYDRYKALSLRVRVDVEVLRQLDGSGLYVYMIENGMDQIGDLYEAFRGDMDVHVDLEDNRAAVVFMIDELPSPRMEFFRQEDRWRWNPLSLRRTIESRISQRAVEYNVTVDLALVGMISEGVGRYLQDTIWETPEPGQTSTE
jgi:hypothetical protein